MTRVLVTTASRHGATDELAHVVGEVLAEHGLDVEVQAVDDVDDPPRYDAFVLGSAVYMGRWLPAARGFAADHRALLEARPTWLFSSGPIGELGGDAPPADGEEVAAAIHARDHHVFGGRLDRTLLNRRERIVTGLVRAPDGDHREWDSTVAWATAIGRTLAEDAQVPAGG